MSYIKGTISKIIYRNNSNGYTVGLIKIKESDEEVGKIETFTGVLPEFNEKTREFSYNTEDESISKCLLEKVNNEKKDLDELYGSLVQYEEENK